MAYGDMYRHRKGGLYWELLRPTADQDYRANTWVNFDELNSALVTDDIKADERYVVYEGEYSPEQPLFARPEAMFDDGRFTLEVPDDS